ncbi:MAG: sugar-binding protein [Selenomonadaceae bacterium]|nr:sugar-binding protein [Selenomonadaceae bacterium]
MRIFKYAWILIFFALLTGCGNSADVDAPKKVAICFPGNSGNWDRNGAALKKSLEEESFVVELASSENTAQQQQQLKDIIAKKPNCIVIGAIDSESLVEVLESAKANEIPIVAYDRLIMNTDALSYYASFDNDAVGEAQGLYLEAVLNLRGGGGPYNIEIFAGDTADNNAHVFYNGAMKVLDPYIKNGQLVCRSRQTDFNSVATADWKPENAATRIRELFNSHYSGETLHVVLSPNDDIAGAIIEEFQKAGRPYPVISGQDGTSAAIDRIRNGQQTFTVNKDAELLTAKCVRMIKAVVEGTQPDINDVTSYNNGVKIIPAYLCTPLIVDKTNIKDF